METVRASWSPQRIGAPPFSCPPFCRLPFRRLQLIESPGDEMQAKKRLSTKWQAEKWRLTKWPTTKRRRTEPLRRPNVLPRMEKKTVGILKVPYSNHNLIYCNHIKNCTCILLIAFCYLPNSRKMLNLALINNLRMVLMVHIYLIIQNLIILMTIDLFQK